SWAFDARVLDDVRVFFRVLVQEGGELPRRGGPGFQIDRGQLRVDLRVLQRAANLRAQPLGNVPGRTRRGEQAIPERGHEARHAGFGRGGNGRRGGQPGGSRHGQRREFLGAYVLQRRGDAEQHDI